MIIDPEIMEKVITHGIEAYPTIIHAQMKANIIEGIVACGSIFLCMSGVIAIIFIGFWITMRFFD